MKDGRTRASIPLNVKDKIPENVCQEVELDAAKGVQDIGHHPVDRGCLAGQLIVVAQSDLYRLLACSFVSPFVDCTSVR